MQINIPVKPHVKAFFLSAQMLGPKDESQAAEPVQVRRDSHLGHLLSGFLGLYPVEPVTVPALTLGERMTTLTIEPTFAVNVAFLTDENLSHIGQVLEYQFKFALIAFTQGAMSIHPSEQGGVKRFYLRYGLSEEQYDFEAAFKIVQRFRARGDAARKPTARKQRPVSAE